MQSGCLPSAGREWFTVLIDESTRDGLLCSSDSYCCTIGVFGCLRFCQRDAWAQLQDSRWPRPNLGPGYKCTAIVRWQVAQLLPSSWNRRCASSPFNLTPLCPCIKSSITGSEWALRRMIVLTDWWCINLIAFFFLSPCWSCCVPLQKNEQPRCITARTYFAKLCFVAIWRINMANEDEITQVYLHHYDIIGFIVP